MQGTYCSVLPADRRVFGHCFHHRKTSLYDAWAGRDLHQHDHGMLPIKCVNRSYVLGLRH